MNPGTNCEHYQRESTTFFVGKMKVSFPYAEASVLSSLRRLFPPAQETGTDGSADTKSASPNLSYILNKPYPELEPAIYDLVGCLLEPYQGNLWVDASVLISSGGKRLMLAGAGESGKSTLTVAIAHYCGWSVVCEDTAFVLPDLTIPARPRPISIRPGTVERIAEQTGVAIELVEDRWYFHSSMFSPTDIKAPLDHIIMIRPVVPENPGPIQINPIAPERLLRELLPCGSALRKADGIDLLQRLLKEPKCWLLEGGNIKDRILALETIAS